MTAEDAIPNFHDKESEVRYWKSRFYDLQDTLRETEASLHDFMDSSKELEKEMDREISAANSKANELQLRSEKLKSDVDEWKSKYQRALTDHNKTLAELNRELSTLRESHNIYKNQMRDLELNNDELENAERMVASSLNDMESRYNKAIERTALLEEELVEKSRLEEENQRLKDELQEANEELAVLRESLSTNRNISRTHTPAEPSSSNGRSSVDDMQLSDLLSRNRPSSRSSGRPGSSSGFHRSPPLPRVPLPTIESSSKVKALASSRVRHSRTESRDTKASIDDSFHGGMTSSPSSSALRPRQSQGPSSFRTTVTSRTTPRSSTFATREQQPGASKTMISDMFKRMRALEKRLADTRNGIAITDAQSAIPRPSSRLSSSIGHGGTSNLTPRRSIDNRREESGLPSSIPVPLSKSTSRRPTSRLSTASGMEGTSGYLPSSLRCQTPTFESGTGGATLDFLDHDPSKIRRRSHLAMASSTSHSSLGPHSGSSTSANANNHHSHLGSSVTRPRGSTITSSGHLSRGESLRKSTNPGTGRPAPPLAYKPGQSMSRQRSSSIGSN